MEFAFSFSSLLGVEIINIYDRGGGKGGGLMSAVLLDVALFFLPPYFPPLLAIKRRENRIFPALYPS